MRVAKEVEGRQCPKCKSIANQIKAGFTNYGSQRCLCKNCNHKYTLNPKPHAYSQEIQDLAIKEYYSGISGRGVGKIHKMHHANVLRWIKKNQSSVDKSKNKI
jgi:transposase-like protein